MFKVGDKVKRDPTQNYINWGKECLRKGLDTFGTFTISHIRHSDGALSFREVGGIWFPTRYTLAKTTKKRIV